jgi:ABC-type amino acid transport substrate-binding protein
MTSQFTRPPVRWLAFALVLALLLASIAAPITAASSLAAQAGDQAQTPAQARPASARPELRYLQKIEEKTTADGADAQRFQEALGAALARHMERQVRFVSLPRKRMADALEAGEADIMCSYLPAWTSGDFRWSRPFIPVAEVLVSSNRVAAPRHLLDVKNKRIGTVLGFRYPAVELALGPGFIRDDAPTSYLTLRKWQVGRFDYFLTVQSFVDRQLKNGELPAGLHLLVFSEYKTMCALSRRSRIGKAELDSAIAGMEKSGELATLLQLR